MRIVSLKKSSGKKYNWDNIVGRSPGMQQIFATVMRVAPSRATVLLAGESGVGKDLIARAIHFHSPRHDRPFVKINCTALPENLMESELFGYEKGAFTGANISKPGKFEQADTGTVMLDEIGDVPGNIQVKLLRVLQEREVRAPRQQQDSAHRRARDRRHQSRSARRARRRHVPRRPLLPAQRCAHRNPAAARAQRRHPLSGAASSWISWRRENGGRVRGITDAAIDKLMQYSWPGNVREIENVIERSIVMTTGDKLDADDIRLDMNLRARARRPANWACPKA